MAGSQVEAMQMQLQSSRKAILFMESEHANTLRGLHKEIQQLQKKCSELTFELAMKDDNTDSMSPDRYREEQLERDVNELVDEKIKLVQEVEQRDRQLVELEEHARAQERMYLNELKAKNHRITSLMKELDARSTTVAYVTTQLHQARSKLHSVRQMQQQVAGNVLAPTPPVGQRKYEGVHRSSKSMEDGSRPNSARHLRGRHSIPSSRLDSREGSRPNSSSSSSSRDNHRDMKQFDPSPMPDPGPFLRAGSKEVKMTVYAPRPPSVLPPIHKNMAANVDQDPNGNEVLISWQQQGRVNAYAQAPSAQEFAVKRVATNVSPERKVNESGV
nr:coiled-coil domain-containing protein 92-like [Ciona intestinalis]|eukprot:XP_002126442.1 coiled-coil domain-containing protein 92-like [Ciona intestinalis]